MEAGYAGNVVQMVVFLGICVGYISTYIIRVAKKDMTYAKQLEEYEEAVMARRLSELAPDELDRLMTEVRPSLPCPPPPAPPWGPFVCTKHFYSAGRVIAGVERHSFH